MWTIPAIRQINPDIVLITRDQEDLIYYDEPILFTGLNSQNNRILASFIDYEKNTNTAHYFFSIVNEGDYTQFLLGSISLPEAMRRASLLSVLSWSGEACDGRCAIVTFDEIPGNYRPSEQAFLSDRHSLLSAMPTFPHPGGKLVKVVAHYEDGATQTTDGEVVTNAIVNARRNSRRLLFRDRLRCRETETEVRAK